MKKAGGEEFTESNLLRDELQVALLAAEDIKALRTKSSMLVERLREEKEKRLKIEERQEATTKKLAMVTDHVEKLMTQLKIEAKQKLKLIDSRRSVRKQLQEMRQLCERQQKIIESKNRYIIELTEGSRLLEDQLRLMDEKYLTIRQKLEYAREQQRIEVNKAQKESAMLRYKFQEMTGSRKLLDFAQTAPSGGMGKAVSWADFQDTTTSGAPRSSSRAKSAPNKRGSASSPLVGSDSQKGELSIDKVLEKIDKKRPDTGQRWTVEKARELVGGGHHSGKPKPQTAPKQAEAPSPARDQKVESKPGRRRMSLLDSLLGQSKSAAALSALEEDD